MRNKKRLIAAGVVGVMAAGGALTGVAIASSDDEQSRPITGSAYDRATSVAIRVAGGGTVTETEVGDEEGYYQVEVTKADGSQIDVNMDKSFHVVKTKTEAGGTGDDR